MCYEAAVCFRIIGCVSAREEAICATKSCKIVVTRRCLVRQQLLPDCITSSPVFSPLPCLLFLLVSVKLHCFGFGFSPNCQLSINPRIIPFHYLFLHPSVRSCFQLISSEIVSSAVVPHAGSWKQRTHTHTNGVVSRQSHLRYRFVFPMRWFGEGDQTKAAQQVSLFVLDCTKEWMPHDLARLKPAWLER